MGMPFIDAKESAPLSVAIILMGESVLRQALQPWADGRVVLPDQLGLIEVALKMLTTVDADPDRGLLANDPRVGAWRSERECPL
jgi:hypothetical protein